MLEEALHERELGASLGVYQHVGCEISLAEASWSFIIINVLSAGIAEAGSSQAGDIACDFKIGHLVGAKIQAQLYGQIIGIDIRRFHLMRHIPTVHVPVPDTRSPLPDPLLLP